MVSKAATCSHLSSAIQNFGPGSMQGMKRSSCSVVPVHGISPVQRIAGKESRNITSRGMHKLVDQSAKQFTLSLVTCAKAVKGQATSTIQVGRGNNDEHIMLDLDELDSTDAR